MNAWTIFTMPQLRAWGGDYKEFAHIANNASLNKKQLIQKIVEWELAFPGTDGQPTMAAFMKSLAHSDDETPSTSSDEGIDADESESEPKTASQNRKRKNRSSGRATAVLPLPGKKSRTDTNEGVNKQSVQLPLPPFEIMSPEAIAAFYELSAKQIARAKQQSAKQ
jgi:hypothetical protein